MEIMCCHNNGYHWTQTENVCFKGYLCLVNDKRRILMGNAACDYFDGVETFSQFKGLLCNVEGVYAVIVKTTDRTWAAVDIACSMPLYFAADGSVISDSAEKIRETLGIAKEAADPVRLTELMVSTFICGGHTAYSEIRKIELGQAIEVSENAILKERYYLHYAKTVETDLETAKARLLEVSDAAMEDTLAAIGGRPVVLSLSGGYDSRSLACLLKRHGVENVSCYTYGKNGSFEVLQSQKVADALGYRWTNVEYDDDSVRALRSEENAAFWAMSDGHDFPVYLQNYLAVKKLHKAGWFEPDSVFLTRLCYDMPTGEYVKPEAEVQGRYSYTLDGAAEYLLDQRFVRYALEDKARAKLKAEAVLSIKELGIEITNYQSFVCVVDAIMTGYDHSCRFLHMNDAHGFFGYEWLLPCWNRRLLDFWYKVPYKLRVSQSLYEECLIKGLAGQYGLGTKKSIAAHGKSARIVTIKRALGAVLVKIAYPLGIPLRRKADINNFAPLEVLLYKNIHQKKMIDAHRAALILLQTVYVMEQRYGDKFAPELCVKKMK